MDATSSSNAEIRALRQELSVLRSDLAAIRLRRSINAMTIDLGLLMLSVDIIFFVAMKVT